MERWQIELFFRQNKNKLALDNYQVRSTKGIKRYWLLMSLAHFYGASESLALGVETEPEKGMLLFDDLNIIEVENGKMYLTCLYNYVQPLIRYHLTDSIILQKPEEGDACPFTRAAGLLGRNEDILWFQDGNGNKEFLHPLAVEGFCIEGLKDYQFRQTGRDSLIMYAETDDGKETKIQKGMSRKKEIREQIMHQMYRILEEKKLSYVQFRVDFVKEILPDVETGKKKLIINKEKGTFNERYIAAR